MAESKTPPNPTDNPTTNPRSRRPTPRQRTSRNPSVSTPLPPSLHQTQTPHILTHLTPSATIASPINLILLALFIYLLYLRLRPTRTPTLPSPPPPIVFRTFTPPALRPYNGTHDTPVYLSVRGRVFDVSPGRNFYGPGGPYENFAGRDASRGLACGSFDEGMLTGDLEGPLDDLRGLGEGELEALGEWEGRFEEKYLVVGRLVAVGSEGV